jgi:hypothetical protein
MLIALTSFSLGAIARGYLCGCYCCRRACECDLYQLSPHADTSLEIRLPRFSPRRRLAFSANIVHRIRIYMNSFF